MADLIGITPKNDQCSYAETLRALVELRSDESYLKLTSFYQHKTFWEIAAISRWETSHSAFLSWLLDPNESHGLRSFALERLMQVVGYAVTLGVNQRWLPVHSFASDTLISSLATADFKFYEVEVGTEISIDLKNPAKDHKRNRGRLDVLIRGKFSFRNEGAKPFQIIIENKVLSKEGDSQTEDYFDWVQQGRKEGEETLMLFLTPRSSHDVISPDSKPLCKSPGFIEINYQMILDYIIEPAITMTISQATRSILEDYVRALSTPSTELNGTEKAKEATIMAISSRERELLVGFFESNRPFLQKMCEALAQDDDLEGDENAMMVAKGVQAAMAATRDNSKYTVRKGTAEFKELGKGRMIVQVMKLFCDAQTPPETMEILRSAEFVLSGRRKLLMTQEEMDAYIAKSKNQEGERIRYYNTVDDQIHGPDNVAYFVHTQWGIENATKFIERFRKAFPNSGIEIEKE